MVSAYLGANTSIHSPTNKISSYPWPVIGDPSVTQIHTLRCANWELLQWLLLAEKKRLFWNFWLQLLLQDFFFASNFLKKTEQINMIPQWHIDNWYLNVVPKGSWTGPFKSENAQKPIEKPTGPQHLHKQCSKLLSCLAILRGFPTTGSHHWAHHSKPPSRIHGFTPRFCSSSKSPWSPRSSTTTEP